MSRNATVNVSGFGPGAEEELARFWTANPDLRDACTAKYGFDPINNSLSYWRYGLAEEEHSVIANRVQRKDGRFDLRDVKQWEEQEVASAKLESVDKSGVPTWAHYRPATQTGISCGTCDYFVAGRCEMFDLTPVKADMVCDRWDGPVEKDDHDPMYTATPPPAHPVEENPQSLIDLIGALEPRGGKLLPELTEKGTSHGAEVNLRVHGMNRAPDGRLLYRMETRDGHYIGRTNPTSMRAKKGDILKVQANDFLQSANGDFQWDNPNVISHYSDAAHSWRELCALAGGDLAKDTAPGPAGDIPAVGDPGATSAMPSGPTLESVHINSPLQNISISYGPRKLKYKVQKTNKHKQLIYGVVLEPDTLDSQDDYMLPDQVQRAAHKYMKNVVRGKASVSKLGHRSKGFFKNKPSVVPVESFIAPTDFSYDGKETVKKGTWVMVLHAEDPNVWDDVIQGKYTGLSIGGTGIRQDAPPLEGMEGLYSNPSGWFK